jgi:UDP-2,3-diacylglucosamine hydrolase
MSTLFVSDLHLCPTRPETTAAFLGFLRGPARVCEALYILGDLFEYWAGDDDAEEPLNRDVAQALTRLADAGPTLYFMAGNRDFLLGGQYAALSRLTLLPDPTLIELHGVPTLLMHGDTLCTDDAAYLAFRATVRDPAWIAAFLARPLAQRKATIEELRRRSEAEKQRKPMEIMDANDEAVAQALRRHGYPRLIHGHTHRPARHEHVVDGRRCERWVLADWYLRGSYLACDAAGCRSLPL